MDVWVLTAAKEGMVIRPVVIEVFAFEPTLDDKRRAVRDHVERKFSPLDYNHGNEVLRQEDIERAFYNWPESYWKVECKTLRGRFEVLVKDGSINSLAT